ncbi:hypothetical protein, partial [Fibrobacter sp. UWCM]|uniref:hypothetical protein n=1 Tax=Fibrobacter sp. UWCM TaxID=1896208 RepID=UPI001C31E211
CLRFKNKKDRPALHGSDPIIAPFLVLETIYKSASRKTSGKIDDYCTSEIAAQVNLVTAAVVASSP